MPRRPKSQLVPVAVRVRERRALNPALVFVYGFAALILVGAAILMTPLASADGRWTPWIDALFTSTSAVCVTGLVVVDTGTYWSPFGHAVILGLIQIGGLGFMTSSTLLLRLVGRRASLRERMLLREALGSGGLGSAVVVARRIVIFTLIAEAVGMVVLTLFFLRQHDPLTAAWWGLFFAVSAFNNAGFDLVGDFASLTPYRSDPVLLLTVAGLLILGSISFAVVDDIVRNRRFARLSLDTKLVLVTTVGLLAFGTIALLITERDNVLTFGAMDFGYRLLNAFFMATSPRSGGFATVDVGQMMDASLLLLIALMLIGGSAGSTGGGIKVQTFGILVGATLSAIRGLPEVELFGRRIRQSDLMRAVAVSSLVLLFVFAVAMVLTFLDAFSFVRNLFEAVSASATVGLSTGITPDVSTPGRLVLIVAMFSGRLGPVTLMVALAAREHRPLVRWPEETVRIG
ncbi:MAG: Trk family potassium uptake protein [Chloroflexota bacterium]|nr:Trk family potassium uptake protein [Chloroflexota bacterium]